MLRICRYYIWIGSIHILTTFSLFACISLRRNELSGTIPTELGNLIELEVRKRYLQEICINYVIRSAGLTEFSLLHSVSRNKTLYLDSNARINGTIPSELSKLEKLNGKSDIRCSYVLTDVANNACRCPSHLLPHRTPLVSHEFKRATSIRDGTFGWSCLFVPRQVCTD